MVMPKEQQNTFCSNIMHLRGNTQVPLLEAVVSSESVLSYLRLKVTVKVRVKYTHLIAAVQRQSWMVEEVSSKVSDERRQF
jgi:hypothetical protein